MSSSDDVRSDEEPQPGPAEQRPTWRTHVERLATVVALGAAGLWAGGLVALGVFGGVDVFASLPASLATEAQAAALGHFDGVALGCAAFLLASEMAHSALALRRPRTTTGRLRRLCALSLGVCAVYLALVVTPATTQLQTAGVIRGVGPHSVELAELEQRGLTVRRIEMPLLALLVLLQVWTSRGRRDDAPS